MEGTFDGVHDRASSSTSQHEGIWPLVLLSETGRSDEGQSIRPDTERAKRRTDAGPAWSSLLAGGIHEREQRRLNEEHVLSAKPSWANLTRGSSMNGWLSECHRRCHRISVMRRPGCGFSSGHRNGPPRPCSASGFDLVRDVWDDLQRVHRVFGPRRSITGDEPPNNWTGGDGAAALAEVDVEEGHRSGRCRGRVSAPSA